MVGMYAEDCCKERVRRLERERWKRDAPDVEQ